MSYFDHGIQHYELFRFLGQRKQYLSNIRLDWLQVYLILETMYLNTFTALVTDVPDHKSSAWITHCIPCKEPLIIVLKFISCIPICFKDSLSPSFMTLLLGLGILRLFFKLLPNLIIRIWPKGTATSYLFYAEPLFSSIIQVTCILTFGGVPLVAIKSRHGNQFNDEIIILGLVVLYQLPQFLIRCNRNYWAAIMAASRWNNNLVQHAEVTWGS